MLHLGDITKINGAEAPVVDIICGGSPCQDLSVAGKRQGIKHSELGDDEVTRSGLFMEQIRIIKEMRNHDVQNELFFDIEERHENCTVQILKNSVTGAESVGWWKNG